MMLILSVILVIAIVLFKYLYKEYTNPITIFFGVFAVSLLLLYGTDFILKSSISETVWTIYILSFFAFGIGAVIGSSGIKINKDKTPSNDVRFAELSQNVQQERYWSEIIVLFVIMMISTGIYYIYAIARFGFSDLFQSILTTQESEILNGAVWVSYLKFISIFLSPYVTNYLLQYKQHKFFCLSIIAFTIFANLAYTRNTIVYIVVLDLLVLFYSSNIKKRLFSKQTFIFAVVFFGLIWFFSYTQNLLNKEFTVEGSLFGIELTQSWVSIISYFAGPLVTPGFYISQNVDVPFLGYTLRTLRTLFDSFGFLAFETEAYMPTEFVYIPFKFNTTTMQYYIFREGGIAWLMFFYLIMGFAISRIYRKYKKSNSRYSMMALVLISLALVFSIRSYLFVRLDIFVYAMILLLIYCMRKTKFSIRGTKK